MPETARRGPRVLLHSATGLALVALALTALTAIGGFVAALAGVLAQPAIALAVRAHRAGVPLEPASLRRDALALLAVWGAAVVFAGLGIAWPVQALRQGGELGAALATSVVIGLAVIGFWRTWPVWHAVEHEGGDLRQHWRALADHDTGRWRGAAAAGWIARWR